MYDKGISGSNTKILIFTIIIGISLITSQSVELDQADGTTTIPTASFSGVVTKVIDGDTLDVKNKDGKTMAIRLTLVDAPETNEPGYTQAKNFVSQNCLNKAAVVDPDNSQNLSYGRLVAVVYCDDLNINEAVIANGFATIYRSFCDVSEFANTEWAQKYGCDNNDTSNNNGISSKDNGDEPSDCDASYPDACIPSPPPDLDCDDIGYKNFKVVSPDPHGFDGEGDGLGCEGKDDDDEPSDCDASYPDACIPSPPPDLDCREISDKNFKVLSPDPHGFDRDGDGIGCDSPIVRGNLTGLEISQNETEDIPSSQPNSTDQNQSGPIPCEEGTGFNSITNSCDPIPVECPENTICDPIPMPGPPTDEERPIVCTTQEECVDPNEGPLLVDENNNVDGGAGFVDDGVSIDDNVDDTSNEGQIEDDGDSVDDGGGSSDGGDDGGGSSDGGSSE